jgi:hydroxyacylglutathione hydrolase
VEPEKLIAKAQELDVQITTVLTTHSHWDHAGGNNKILGLLPDLKIYGGKGDNAEGVMTEVDEGDVIEIGQLKVRTSKHCA